MHSKTHLPFRSALVLTTTEGESNIDKAALRSCGIRKVSTMRSGAEAARLLSAQRSKKAGTGDQPVIDIILCSDRLNDMDSKQFLQIIRKHPALAALPVIVVSSVATQEAVLSAIGSGCAGYIVRPYPQSMLSKQISRAAMVRKIDAGLSNAQQKLDTSAFDAAIAAFANVVKRSVPKVELLFNEGQKHLAAKDWDKAIRAFNSAVRLNTLYAEAYLGLSRAWRGKGDNKKAQKALKMAGEAYSRLERFSKAREVYAQLLQEAPETQNPLFSTGAAHIKRGKFDSAGKAFVEGAKLTPDQTVHSHIARACQFTNAPEKSAGQVCLAIDKAGNPQLAQRTHDRIVGRPVTPTTPAPKEKLGAIPILQEIAAVMRFTFRTYKQLQLAD